MDPWIAALLGAAGASLVWLAALSLRRRADRQGKATSNASDLVPLVFAPVTALRDIVEAAVPEIRSFFAPGGTVAIVFSDIADSTRLNHRLGDEAWADLLGEHDAAVRAVVRSEGGRVVKRQGDGFMAAFHDAASATRAALALEDAATSALTSKVKLRLRIGVHVGEMVSQRGDYFGTNVVVAARVAAEAKPGTVLVTDAVVEDMGHLDGIDARPLRRAARLRGLEGRHQLHVVRRS